MVEGLYYPCSENKGADQLRSNCAADLRLGFRIFKKPIFLRRGSYDYKSLCYLLLMFRISENFVYEKNTENTVYM